MELSNITVAIVSLLLSILTFTLQSQNRVILNILTDDQIPFEKGELIVSRNDSVVIFEIVDSSPHSFQLPEKSDYLLTLTSKGYAPYEVSIPDSTFTRINIMLERETSTLDEVVVEGHSKSEKTAVGEIFTLSKKAKGSKNPFVALAEIPLLQVDIINQDIRLRDGSSALILIDGKMVNSGIAPIDPKFIEKVEISETVSAKYMSMGISKIIDIKLKREVPLYLFTDFRTRHDLPLREGFGAINFETGTKKFAIFGSVSQTYLFNDRAGVDSYEILDAMSKRKNGWQKNWSRSFNPDLTVKWVPNPADYFALMLEWQDTHSRSRGNAQGSYLDSKHVSLISKSYCKTKSTPISSAAYYEHTFSDKSTLSAFFRYNQNRNFDLETYSEDTGNETNDFSNSEKHLSRNYTFTFDYSGIKKKYGSIHAGNQFFHTSYNLYDRNVDPNEKAKVGLINNYTYLTYTHRWRQLRYMASAGLQYMRVDANGTLHSFWRPRVSASLTFALPKDNTLRANYYLQNQNPSVNYLFVFDNSIDPWMKYEGNPYLVPVMINQTNLLYDKQVGNQYLNLGATHRQIRHLFESYLRNEGDYMIQSYRNNGTYHGYTLTAQFVGSVKNVQGSVTTSYNWDIYAGQHAKGAVGLNGYLRWNFGRFFLFTTLSWRNKVYSEISVTRYNNPMTAHLQVAWRVNEHLYLSVGMPYFWGIRSMTTTTSQYGYLSRVKTNFKSSSLRPWILVSWTLYKNSEHEIEDKISDRISNL